MELHTNESIYYAVIKNNESIYQVCFVAPPPIVSDGIWGDGRTPMKSSLPVYELQVLVIYAVTQLCQFFFKFLDLPVFISQMMAGIILGPSIQNETVDKFKKLLFPFGSQDTLASISSLGYVLYIFLAAVQMDMSMIARVGHKAWTIALIGLVVPILICIPIALNVSPEIRESTGKQLFDLPVVVGSHTAASFAVIASLLNELKITNSELGRLALSSVLLSDVVTLTCSSTITAIKFTDPKWRVFCLTSLIAVVVFVPLIFR